MPLRPKCMYEIFHPLTICKFSSKRGPGGARNRWGTQMSSPTFLEFHAAGLDLKFKVALLANDNPDVVGQVVKRLPLESVLGHVVISGESFWLPTRIVHLGRSNMVPRTLGAVYLYAPGQTICLC